MVDMLSCLASFGCWFLVFLVLRLLSLYCRKILYLLLEHSIAQIPKELTHNLKSIHVVENVNTLSMQH